MTLTSYIIVGLLLIASNYLTYVFAYKNCIRRVKKELDDMYNEYERDRPRSRFSNWRENHTLYKAKYQRRD